MKDQSAHVSTYARHVGRVGALAAALGIGVFVITTPGVATADSTSSSTGSSSASSGDNSSTSASATHPIHRHRGTPEAPSATAAADASTDRGTAAGPDAKTADANSATRQVAPGVTVSSSGVHVRLPGAGHFLKHVADAAAPAKKADATSTSSTASGSDTDDTTAAAAIDTPAGAVVDAAAQRVRKSSTAIKANVKSALSESVTTTAPAADPISVKDDVANVIDKLLAPVAKQLSDLEAKATTTTQAVRAEAAAVASSVTAAAAPTTTSQVPQAGLGVVTLLNTVVTKLLNPFLNPAPQTPGPVVPIAWAVLGWVRRNVFNEAPTIAYDPTKTVQTGQTVTGYVGATDPEHDKLTYTVTQQPTDGTVTIDQATGKYTYTPNDIDYDGTQTDSFTVSVTDGKTNLLSLFGQSHSAQQAIGVTVQPPTATRVVVPLPDGFTNASIPRFAADGQSLLFSATPPGSAAGARMEIYHVNVDGTGLSCVTCGIADPTPLAAGSTAPRSLFKPVPFEDGS